LANVKPKSPEEIMKEIEKLKKQYELAEVELKESRRASVTEAVRKAGVDFEEKFKVYLSKRKNVHAKEEQAAKIKAEIQGDLQYLKDQYKFIRDMLVGEGAKEEYLIDVLGEPPTVKAATTTGTGVGKKRTKAKLADGTTSTWNDLLTKHGIVHKEGNSAHREWDAAKAANPNLPAVEVVTVE
jgi:hypothetical protein